MLQVIHQYNKIPYCWSRRDLGALLQNRQNILVWVATRCCSSTPALHSSLCKRAIISSCSCSFSCCCWYFACEEIIGAFRNYSNWRWCFTCPHRHSVPRKLNQTASGRRVHMFFQFIIRKLLMKCKNQLKIVCTNSDRRLMFIWTLLDLSKEVKSLSAADWVTCETSWSFWRSWTWFCCRQTLAIVSSSSWRIFDLMFSTTFSNSLALFSCRDARPRSCRTSSLET